MAYPPAASLLREYFHATNWSLDNHYHNLTLPSRNLLDFPVPPGLNLALSHRPLPTFNSTLSLTTLAPSTPPLAPPDAATTSSSQHHNRELLTGQMTYIASSVPLSKTSTRRGARDQERISVQDVVQAFRVPAWPLRPDLRDDAREYWHRGSRYEQKGETRSAGETFLVVLGISLIHESSHRNSDFLLYGKLYAPAPRLDALFIRRHSTTFQTLVSLITVPSPLPTPQLTWAAPDDVPGGDVQQQAVPPPTSASAATRMSELEVKLQQDHGRWSAEYSYAFGDSMWGARGMYNFGKWGSGLPPASPTVASDNLNAPSSYSSSSTADSLGSEKRQRVVDEADGDLEGTDLVSTGLKGRWSAGGEVFFSAQERAAGVSTGIRFTTLPLEPSSSSSSSSSSAGAVASPSPQTPLQPPTTITATLNPIMGQLSTAYSVGGVGALGDTALASRFDFNWYSYDAEVTIGGEWFQRRKRLRARLAESDLATTTTNLCEDDNARVSVPVRDSFDAFGRGTPVSTASSSEVHGRRPLDSSASSTSSNYNQHHDDDGDEVIGVLKARTSTNSDMSLLWEGRLGDFLVSLGVVADLRLTGSRRGNRVNPIRSVGVGIQYWG